MLYFTHMKPLVNKKGLYNYEKLETFEAGLKLIGTEVKSVRAGRVSFEGAYVTFSDTGAYIVNLTIPAYQPKNAPAGYDPERPRKLLLNKKEVAYLRGKTQEKGLTVIPTKLYTVRSVLKLEIAVVRRKKARDKREDLKRKAHTRDAERELKDRL